jgi:hypothetical protein
MMPAAGAKKIAPVKEERAESGNSNSVDECVGATIRIASILDVGVVFCTLTSSRVKFFVLPRNLPYDESIVQRFCR